MVGPALERVLCSAAHKIALLILEADHIYAVGDEELG
jgi:hypothetical protein